MREPDKSGKSTWWRVRAACTALGRDRDGSVFFYTTLALPVLVGFAVLALDGSRLMNLHSHLQHAADGLALAAAGELDRRPDACIRAVRALTNLVENEQRFGDAGAAVITMADVNYRFLSGLPASDNMPILASFEVTECEDEDDETNSVQDVRFIEVPVNPQTLTTLMPAAFIGGSTTAAANATAVAGFDAAVCEFTPLFICNPYEDNDPSTPTIFEASQDRTERRKQIKFHSAKDNSDGLSPGAFGLLKPPNDPTLPALRRMLAVDKPPACFLQNGVNLKPGISSVGNWINVRFDLYANQQGVKDLKSEHKYRPAKNVRKNFAHTAGKECSPDEISEPGRQPGLPRDNCFLPTESCTRIGDGMWDFEAYWDDNFSASGTAKPTCDDMECSNANPPTRYEIYRYEIDQGIVDDNSTADAVNGAPQCFNEAVVGPLDDDPDRRILYGAVVNCAEYEIKGNSVKNVPVEAFAEFFLTEPVVHEPSDPETVWVELKGIVEPGNSTVARDRVQLYR